MSSGTKRLGIHLCAMRFPDISRAWRADSPPLHCRSSQCSTDPQPRPDIGRARLGTAFQREWDARDRPETRLQTPMLDAASSSGVLMRLEPAVRDHLVQHARASALQHINAKIGRPARSTNSSRACADRFCDLGHGQQQRANVVAVHEPTGADQAMPHANRQRTDPMVRAGLQQRHLIERGISRLNQICQQCMVRCFAAEAATFVT